MEANELFIFKQFLLSLGTHGCNNLFIPPTGERPLLEEREWRGAGREGAMNRMGGREKNRGRVMNLQVKDIALFIFAVFILFGPSKSLPFSVCVSQLLDCFHS